MCRPRPSPIVAIIVAELAATPRPSIRIFQTLVGGKTGQEGAPGTVGAVPTASGASGRWSESRPS